MPLSVPNRWFLLIIFLAVCFRVYDISTESLWVDELHSLNTAQLSPISLVKADAQDNHPPLYSLLLHYWIKLTGNSECALRSLSVLFSLGSIIIFYFLVLKLTDYPTALYTTALCAFSYFQVHYAQEVRSYACALFLALVSIYMMLLLLDRRHKLHAIIYLITTVLLIYTHYLGIFILLGQQIYVIYLRYYRKQERIPIGRFFLLQLIIIILFIPWIHIFILRALDLRREFWVTPPDIYTIPKTILVYAGTYSFFGILVFFLMMAVMVYSYSVTKWNTKDTPIVFAGIFFLIPILAPLFISLFWSPLYIIRLTIVSSVFLYFLVGIAIRNIRRPFLRTVVFLLLVFCSAANLYIYYSEMNKERWHEAVDFVDKNATSGDLLLFHAPFGQRGFVYYSSRSDLKSVPVPLQGYDITEYDLADIKSRIRFHKQIWLILTHARDEKKLLDYLQSELIQQEKKEYISYGVNSHKPYVGIAVYRFLKN